MAFDDDDEQPHENDNLEIAVSSALHTLSPSTLKVFCLQDRSC